ncbi:MAG: LysR family transcriptional regulator [Boseongicola sp.]|nr:MAG: LysR family transcriptional regulator [Boseongicola sp.]
MDNLRKDVHLLRNIVTFRAASVSENFTKAAVELGISRVAVSRQIAELEQALNTRLFSRNHRKVALTRSGSAFAEMVNPAMQTIEEAMEQQRANKSDTRLTITVTSAFATYWLMPRLIDFGAQHPDIEINLVASDRYLDIGTEGIDVAIRYGPTVPQGPGWEPIMQEAIFPVFSPNYNAQTDLRNAEALLNERLLYLSGRYRREARWEFWFESQGLPAPEERSGVHVNTYINMLQAAIEGQGIALAGHPLVDTYLENGELQKMPGVPPLQREMYFLYATEQHRPARVFRSWLKEKIWNAPESLASQNH